jgi:hypothetical protein
MQARGHLGVDQNVGIDSAHGSASVHYVKQFVTIEEVNHGLLAGFPALHSQPVPRAWSTSKGLPQEIVCRCLQGSSFVRRSLFELTKDGIIDLQSCSSHALKGNAI